MKITRLIQKLEKIKETYGEVWVYKRREDNNYDSLVRVSVITDLDVEEGYDKDVKIIDRTSVMLS